MVQEEVESGRGRARCVHLRRPDEASRSQSASEMSASSLMASWIPHSAASPVAAKEAYRRALSSNASNAGVSPAIEYAPDLQCVALDEIQPAPYPTSHC